MKKILLIVISSIFISCSSDENGNNTPTPVVTIPVLTTSVINNITLNEASSGGNITSNGGSDITARGVVWSTLPNPTISLTSKTTDGVGIGTFTSNIVSLTPNTTYYVRAYATNSIGTSYGNEINFTTASIQLPVLTTTAISNIGQTTSVSGGTISSDGGGAITARGVVWSTSQNPTVALSTKTTDGSGIGTFISNIISLSTNTQYYVRAYATNGVGTAYGNELTFTTQTNIYAAMYPIGTVFCNSVVTAIVDVTNPVTGKTWMDRNLGASQVATSSTDAASYGDLYQWGRRADGHQCRNSSTTNSLSSADQPIDGNFILSPNSPNDWRNPQNSNLWQGINGVNNPCPNGYRLPTSSEINDERNSWNSNDGIGAFSSPLKFPKAGRRTAISGSLNFVATSGYYWHSTFFPTNSAHLDFTDAQGGAAGMNSTSRAFGQSVRCIKN
jgi:uncharacterized protein (TIGR02145 family)